jgi:hypothetical protein
LAVGIDTVLERKLREWTAGRGPVQARISVYERVRDIPYAVVPELIDSERYVDILELGRGSCSPKHFLLCEMFQRLGLLVLFVVYPFHWGERAEVMDGYPQVRRRALSLPMSHHLACKVEIEGRLVLVDATLDPPLEKMGLPVNRHWDGFSDTRLPMVPSGPEELFHPLEAFRMQPRSGQQWLDFYAELNSCLEEARRLCQASA